LQKSAEKIVEKIVEKTAEKTAPSQNNSTQLKVNSMSLKSIVQNQLLEAQKAERSNTSEIHEKEPYTEEELWNQWHDYAQILLNKGERIKHSLMLMTKPRLDGHLIYHELPNLGSKMEFEEFKNAVLRHLRTKLRNHDIDLKIHVNEEIIKQKAFSIEEKANRFNEMNPDFELLRKLLDLEI
jgi:hypothetical protein